ncbi:probable protein phosphatase DDB_G0282105 [Bombyx mori]|uniref:Uncharacterized protein n=1 Tax=Bombyx mori TaxID=7091 RepID=A0A8R2M5K7_BOMMO|nr:probable protein phosphatase DDB_G0282105 [Bombyx mori]
MKTIYFVLLISVCAVSAIYLPDDSISADLDKYKSESFGSKLYSESKSYDDDNDSDSESDNENDSKYDSKDDSKGDSKDDSKDDSDYSKDSNSVEKLEKERQKLLKKEKEWILKKEKKELERNLKKQKKELEKNLKKEKKELELLYKKEKEEKDSESKSIENLYKQEKIWEKEDKKSKKLEAKEKKKLEKDDKKNQAKKGKKNQKKEVNVDIDIDQDSNEFLNVDILVEKIYNGYGLTDLNTDIEKKIALQKFLEVELGISAKSTIEERNQAILDFVTKISVNTQTKDVAQKNLFDKLNILGVNYILKELENEIIELGSDELNKITNPLINTVDQTVKEKTYLVQAALNALTGFYAKPKSSEGWINDVIPLTSDTASSSWDAATSKSDASFKADVDSEASETALPASDAEKSETNTVSLWNDDVTPSKNVKSVAADVSVTADGNTATVDTETSSSTSVAGATVEISSKGPVVDLITDAAISTTAVVAKDASPSEGSEYVSADTSSSSAIVTIRSDEPTVDGKLINEEPKGTINDEVTPAVNEVSSGPSTIVAAPAVVVNDVIESPTGVSATEVINDEVSVGSKTIVAAPAVVVNDPIESSTGASATEVINDEVSVGSKTIVAAPAVVVNDVIESSTGASATEVINDEVSVGSKTIVAAPAVVVNDVIESSTGASATEVINDEVSVGSKTIVAAPAVVVNDPIESSTGASATEVINDEALVSSKTIEVETTTAAEVVAEPAVLNTEAPQDLSTKILADAVPEAVIVTAPEAETAITTGSPTVDLETIKPEVVTEEIVVVESKPVETVTAETGATLIEVKSQ